METSIVQRKQSDGNPSFQVVFVDGSTVVELACIDQIHAFRLQEAIQANAEYAVVR